MKSSAEPSACSSMANHLVKLVEQSKVGPPPGSVPSTSLPLTFFDVPWLLCCPMQRLYLYEFPHPTHYFIQTILPNLKHSLSLTLQHFFPFSANLICPPSPAKPHIFYADGDSIPFTVVESTADFNHLIAADDYPLEVQQLHPFVPNLPPPARMDDNNDTRVAPLMALQVSVFPNLGVCIGVTFRHVVADGRAFHHFMKSWASVCRTCGGEDLIRSVDMFLQPPFHDRAVVDDPDGLELIFLKEWWKWGSTWNDDDAHVIQNKNLAGKVRATFVMDHTQIERLKSWVKNQCSSSSNNLEPLYSTSTFVVTCALIWVCLVKSQEFGESNNSTSGGGGDKPYYFIFVADCRNRLGFSLIPSTYFGNCLAFCFVPVKRSELLGLNGIVAAAKAIGNRVKELESSGAVKGAEKWMLDCKEVSELWDKVIVAGSPRLGVYETDFGWGKPRKSEIVHIDVSGGISLAENREDQDGIEVGLALNKAEMEYFKAILEESLRNMDASTCEMN